MSPKVLLGGATLSLSLVLMPAAALAVNVSSGDGSGSQSRVTSYANGAKVAGTLRSTSGEKVYYQGLVDKSPLVLCPDENIGRYTGDVTSPTSVSVGGTITVWPLGPGCSVNGVKSKVCKAVFGPDICGPWSDRY